MFVERIEVKFDVIAFLRTCGGGEEGVGSKDGYALVKAFRRM